VHHRAQKLVILPHHRFDLFKSPVTLLLGHGSILSLVVHHSQLLTMTSLFAEPSGHYRAAFSELSDRRISRLSTLMGA
jgi:hypothetical protein